MEKDLRLNHCEWCGTQYPEFDKTVNYYEVNVFYKSHIICSDCIKNLKLI